MQSEDADALRATGLAHLLAISGLHLSIVGGLVFLLVKRALVLIEPLALRVAVQKPAAIVALIAVARRARVPDALMVPYRHGER